jgi:RecJ-like exonuclease
MSNAEVVGRMFAGSMNYRGVRSSAGAVLSKAELAGLLARLSAHEMNLTLAKYGCDEDAKRKLVGNVTAYVTAVAMERGWKPRNAELLGGLARLAVYEVVGGLLCAKCNGTGLASVVRVCKCCEGTGHKRLSRREMATIVGVDQAQWLRVWNERYAVVFDYVTGLDTAVIKQLHRAEFERIEA